MCGIAGLLRRSGCGARDDIEAIALAMAGTLRHRGPDEGGAWAQAEHGIALSQRRLSIVDLSPAGRQPMISASGRCVIVYNGEVYSAGEMKQALDAQRPGASIRLRGHSDTELLLEAADRLGLLETLPLLIGMFAFALYERDTRRLWLVRDRLGIKPLYWTIQNDTLLFGSELRALRSVPGFVAKIDRDALAAYMRFCYVPHPHTIYQGVNQLPPGHVLLLEPGRAPVVDAYWRLSDIVDQGRARPFMGSDSEAIDAFEELLGDAIRRRMIADVPLGAFLSGGYDSSTVVALMQKHAASPVRTFSIGSDLPGYDEAVHARAVAAHLKTDHTELYVSAAQAQGVIPQLAGMFDEPFADSSQIPTFLVSKLARQHVTVALSGDGGDELFAGYNRYSQGQLFERRLGSVPRAVRQAGARAIRLVAPGSWDRLFALAPSALRVPAAGDKLYKLADVAVCTGDEFYTRLVSTWADPASIVLDANEPMTAARDPGVHSIATSFVERMQYRDLLTYLPDDILTKVDRASMAVSLEARVPLLDHRVAAFAWSLPLHMKLRGTQRKWLLRQVLYRHVPPALVDRPKMGFSVPIDHWLRGPLRDWAEDLLDPSALAGGGLLDPAPIRARWAEHLSGRRNWHQALWTVLMFQAWHRHWHGSATGRMAA